MRKTTRSEHEREVAERMLAQAPRPWESTSKPGKPSKPAVMLPQERKEADKITRQMRGGKPAFLTGNRPRMKAVGSKPADVVAHKGTSVFDGWGTALRDMVAASIDWGRDES